MLMIPQTAEYALRAVSYIAEHQAAGPVPVSTVARALGAPQNYLSKTLHELGRAGVLQSTRGVRGGYRLGAAPDEIRLSDIVEPYLTDAPRRCIMGHERCQDEAPCGAHRRWRELNELGRAFFADLTLGDLLGGESAAPDPLRRGSARPTGQASGG